MCWLLPATVLVLGGVPWTLVGLALLLPGWCDVVLFLALVFFLVTSPFTVVLVHFVVHRPREQRVLLSFVTGLASLPAAVYAWAPTFLYTSWS